MKRTVFVFVALLVVLSAVPAFAGNGLDDFDVNGPHYNLNVIGVDNPKTADMTDTSGHTIFVNASGKSIINLCEANVDTGCDVNTFGVLDRNATGTNNPALFGLPNPDPDGDGTTWYSVFVRANGKPGKSASIQSCYTDSTGTWCAVSWDGGVQPIPLTRDKGQPKFDNVTKDLLYVDYCMEWDTTTGLCNIVDQVPLFSQDASYFWEYTNNGLKLAQFRFYEVETVTGW